MTPRGSPSYGPRFRRLIQRRRAVVELVLIILGVAALIGGTLGSRRAAWLAVEHGPIEMATIVAYAVALIVLIAGQQIDPPVFRESVLVVSLPALRELDVHRAFTSGGVFKTSYWLRDSIPAREKALVALVLLLVAALLIHYLRHAPRLAYALAAGQPYAHSVVTVVALLPIVKLLDEAPLFADRLGVPLSQESQAVAKLLEEMLEVAIPLAITLAAAQYITAEKSLEANAHAGLFANVSGHNRGPG